MKKIIAMCLAATIIGGFSVNAANAENTTPVSTHVKSDANSQNENNFLKNICLKLLSQEYRFLCEYFE
ncbi:hypothetical protein [Xenorhabdus lircayensis]|uniref:Uncharacterized protein n=1 Tax=Xenorhabdus lircayensis TaxID=2763499 RepID=A0ABS0U327_9GAMM|nr:hypothetical protein [Xenorhabdus lircayensis]MBI6548290.1 hypothetical protein [Xenorhabdus lircayensis]